MAKVFLSAYWKNLLMANYICDSNLLKKYLPPKTEIDFFNGICYVSLVAFLFQDTKVMGIKFPYHTHFEEINLRMYVKYKDGSIWKRGVVFIKEIVPKRMITLIANTLYNEKYQTLKTRHTFTETNQQIEMHYQWKLRSKWNTFAVKALNTAQEIPVQSEEEFITEHFWGYTEQKNHTTLEYEVTHPRWQLFPIQQYAIDVDFKSLYGDHFSSLQNQKPLSVFLAAGSDVKVFKGKIIQ